jgi:hypothetical protein
MKNLQLGIQLEFSFGKVTVHDDYIYVIMDEGVTVQPSFNDVLIAIAESYFPEKDFIYITHRIYSYAIDPTIYLKTSQIKNLKGFIVVSPNKDFKEAHNIEKLFFCKPFKVYHTMEEALIQKDIMLYK